MATLRENYLNRRRKRKIKLHHLREQFVSAKEVADRKKILERVHKLAPSLTPDKFELSDKK